MKVDLHTHSIASKDGGIRAEQYEEIITSGRLNSIAITDHNRIDFALSLSAKYPANIIVGEEIMTSDGEIIGLFLKENIEPGLTPLQTSIKIKEQGGLVYVPHPFETVRSGITFEGLNSIKELVDIIEAFNGRALFQNFGDKAADWAKENDIVTAASSDAHGYKGLSYGYSLLKDAPNSENLLKLLSTAKLVKGRAPLKTLLYPKINRIRKSLRTNE